MRSPDRFGRWMLGLGLAFLYLPLLVVVAYSFNAGRLVTVWSGISLRWYAALLHDQALLDAIGVSLSVALSSATLSALLGLGAGLGSVLN